MGMRFNGPELGAWYASGDIPTAAAEVGHHLRREIVARRVETVRRTYRTYAATLLGDYLDIRGRRAEHADIYASDRYGTSQPFGENVRAAGGAGILYDSLRRHGGENVFACRPRNITEILQADHYEIFASATSRRIEVQRLATEG